MGWRRVATYWAHKLKRLQGSPYAIACGFACGAAVSFTPLIGFHFILAAVLAWALRGNIIASAIGTAVGNPWTFPFIWAGIIWLGTMILGYERGQELPADMTIGTIFEEPGTVLLPMLVGGLPTAVVCGSSSSSRSAGSWATTSITVRPGACAGGGRSTRSGLPGSRGKRRKTRTTTSPFPTSPPRRSPSRSPRT